jgi:hypothetical protein
MGNGYLPARAGEEPRRAKAQSAERNRGLFMPYGLGALGRGSRFGERQALSARHGRPFINLSR